MKTLTKIEYSNEESSADGQYTAYITCANDESMASLTQFIESKANIESLGCGETEEDGRVCETFSTEWSMNKKEFMSDLRSLVKDWKALNK
tara:strand:- start:142 stop:414 length:273 start_codon:yes stop_codon:yes gene_type:complete